MLHSLQSILNTQSSEYEFDEPLKSLLGSIEVRTQGRILLWGEAGGGKSTLALQIMEQLCHFGKCLYGLHEEKAKAGTVRRRAELLGIDTPNLMFLETEYLEDLRNELRTGKYFAVCVDSIQRIRNKGNSIAEQKVHQHDMVELMQEFPKVTFVFVSQVWANKSEMKGGVELKHEVDTEIICTADWRTLKRVVPNYKLGDRYAIIGKSRLAPRVPYLFLFNLTNGNLPASDETAQSRRRSRANGLSAKERAARTELLLQTLYPE